MGGVGVGGIFWVGQKAGGGGRAGIAGSCDIAIGEPQHEAGDERQRDRGNGAQGSWQVGEHEHAGDDDGRRGRYGQLGALHVELGESLAPQHVQRAAADSGANAAGPYKGCAERGTGGGEGREGRPKGRGRARCYDDPARRIASATAHQRTGGEERDDYRRGGYDP